MGELSDLELSYEMFWAGYLKYLADIGAVTAEAPADEIWRMKAEFMAGIRGEPQDCSTEPARTAGLTEGENE